jgi:hypothetical protein
MTDADRRCPLCAAPAAELPARCQRCGADLAGYWRTTARPWLAYNEALTRAAAGDVAAAARSAYAAVTQEPGRFEFRYLLARLLAELGEIGEALEHAQAAAAAAPAPDAADPLLDAILRRKYADG